MNLINGINGSELAHDREWALRVFDQAMGRLEREAADSDKANLFTALKPFLIEPTPDGGYESLAPNLEMTPHAVSMAVLRLPALIIYSAARSSRGNAERLFNA